MYSFDQEIQGNEHNIFSFVNEVLETQQQVSKERCFKRYWSCDKVCQISDL